MTDSATPALNPASAPCCAQPSHPERPDQTRLPNVSVNAGVFRHAVRVYWEDTDAGGIVFYANYLKFFERARTEWLRALGFEQQKMVDDSGAIFVVVDAQIRYLRSARLDDALDISVQVQELTPTTMRIFQQASCRGVLLCEATIRIACVQRERMRPCRIPAPILQAIRP